MQLLESLAKLVERWRATFWPVTSLSELWCATSVKAKLGHSLAATSCVRISMMLGRSRQHSKGAESVFVLVPPNFDPSPDFHEARATAATLRSALAAARPGRVVYLSTIGAQATQSNLLTQHTIIEQVLGELSMPITFLRPGWFMENCSWDVASATNDGVILSFLQPIDKPVPMVATSDIGRVAAELLQETWKGHRVVELEGPHRVTPNEIATTFADLLGRPVRMEPVPRETWESLFKSQGMKNPTPRIKMLDGFNEGWIEFESAESGSRKGRVALEAVLQTLIESR